MDFAASAFQFKSIDDAGRIEGLAAGFGNVDHGGDKILAGAVTKTLAARGGRPLPMLLHHDMKRPIGAWTSWRETAGGLEVEGSLTLATRDAQEAYALAKSGALTGISIGWKEAGRATFEGGVRVLPAIELFEASLVAVPMNDRARVTAIKAITGARDIEDLLRDSGLSGRRAKAAASAAWKTLNENDDDAADAEATAILNASAARIAALGGRNERDYERIY